MSQVDFNSAFKNVMFQSAPPSVQAPRDFVEQIFRRDQRRTRFLAIASLLCWLISVAGMILLVVGLNRFVIGVRIESLVKAANVSSPDGDRAHAEPDDQRFILGETDLLHHSMPYLAASVFAFLMAALFTLLLIFSSRQAALNRINFSLAQIGGEIRRLQGPDSPPLESLSLAASAPVSTPRVRQFWFWTGWTLALAAIVSTAAMSIEYYVARKDLLWIGSPRILPFEAIYWNGETPDVEVKGRWYALNSVNGLPVADIIAFSKRQWYDLWQKHFNEDLVALLTGMGHTPDTTANLGVVDLSSGKPEMLQDVPMTSANRMAVLMVDLGETAPTTRP